MMNEFVAGEDFTKKQENPIKSMGWSELRNLALILEFKNKIMHRALFEMQHSADDKCSDLAREALIAADYHASTLAGKE